ncbi:transcription initiation factor TFIID subunit 9-like [Leptinotarsa decemlineata]|uniref:transcription initiation factor TFIID subunit 9-like n=1 Tax=Leptinotarsa decemlineata TaxID=7539 RepID=UPI000C251909|nr:transcription initiation factor TFIID subunit 9-like [Leptinotarsa decemlineata]XP_023014034.1 transcription initiation factor TFIID subunit 9-like [Leptinotarsa decemlineata]
MMSDKDKSKPAQPKHIPKDGQVIMAIMKEMGITDYEPKTIVQLTEFVYRYATSILEEARMYANNSKKKFLDVDDVRLALQLTCESTFTTPPPREVLLELAQAKNYSALPPVKPHCGLRLPPDRYCLSSCNYTLRSAQKKIGKSNFGISGGPGMKLTPKSNISFLKRTNTPVSKQTVSIPKPVTKINTQSQKTVLKPKIQITQNVQLAPANGMEIDPNSLKRKREDESENGV